MLTAHVGGLFQAIKNKKDEPSKDGTRLNEKITARVVRLVTEDGMHCLS